MTFVRVRRAVLASLLLCGGGACSSSTPGTNPDGSGAGTGGATAGTGGMGGNAGTGGRIDAGSGSGGSASGSGGQSGAGGASGTGGKAGSGGASGSGGAGTGGSGGGVDGGPRDTAPLDQRVAPAMPSFATHVAPVIAAKCSPCHTTEAKAGYNWTYANLVTNSTVTTTIGKCGSSSNKPEPPGPMAANKDCIYMEGNPKRVKPGAEFEFGLLYIKILTEDARLCDAYCGSQMPPADSGKTLDTYERDIFKNWMKSGAMP